MIGKLFYWLGLIENNGPIEFVNDNDTSVLPMFQKVIVD